MKGFHLISSEVLNFDEIKHILQQNLKLKLSTEAVERIQKCRNYLDHKISHSKDSIYGVNTGFGSLYKKSIPNKDLHQLQINLVKSHACGAGEEVPLVIVKLMLLLKIQSLAYGYSGVQLQLVERLIDMFNHEILPVVYEQGSLGASGDLVPLAHLSLPLLHLGEVNYHDEKKAASEVNQSLNWEPINLKAKEGLALLNGTQFISAYGIWCLIQSYRLDQLADMIGALSLDAFDCRIEPFHPLIHKIRPQKGQIKTAKSIMELLEGSEIINKGHKQVQDPYSFRCIPQVHGATKDAIHYVYEIFHLEINGVTDNPNIFPDEDQIISGGNFHAQPLALALDFLCIAMAEMGNISERRTYQLLSGSRGLPEFLVAHPGLNSGLMIPQYVAASIVSQSKQLCTPASVDSIVSSNGQEDHVSMGANAATKALRVIENTFTILAIELICATQALEFRKPLKTSPHLENFIDNFRNCVSFIEEDRVLHQDIHDSVNFLKSCKI
ncbi:MAG: histidine ammonia-lyase [Bacteroidetes bacterium]|nr:histidine ammonia-lyase [Bacteroidota bacterium]